MRIPVLLLATCSYALLLSGCGSSPGYPKPEAEVARPQDQLGFHTLYRQNCAACHGADGQNGAAIDLANPEYQALVDEKSERQWISSGMPGTQMPAFAISAGGSLTDRQIDVLVRGMREQWSPRGTSPRQSPPSYSAQQAGNAQRGLETYNTHCTSCHQGSKQQISSPDYLALVSDQALRSIIIAGRPDIGHPDWRTICRNAPTRDPLGAQDVTDIVTYLGTLRSPTPGQPYSQKQ